MDSIGSKLLRLKERSGLTLNNIAKSGGYKSPSSIQRYFSLDYTPEYLPRAVAQRLSQALSGFGDPPITHTDLYELTDSGFYLHRSFHPDAIDVRRSSWPSISCVAGYLIPNSDDDIPFEVMAFDRNDTIREFFKPERYAPRHIAAIYSAVSSLAPRYNPGEVIFYEIGRPGVVGSDALIEILTVEGEGEGIFALVRLTGQDSTTVAIETYSPPQSLRLPRSRVGTTYAVLSAADLLGEYVT